MKKRLSYLLLIAATVIWGFAFSAQKAAAVLPPFTVGALRSLFAAIFLLCLIPIMDKLTGNGRKILNSKKLPDFNRRELIGGAIIGVILTAGTSFQQYGIGSGSDAGKAAFITALYVVIVPIISTFLGKKPSLLAVISIPIAILGFYLLSIKPGSTFETNDLMVLICAVMFAAHIISVDRLSPGCDGIRLSCIQFATSLVLNAVLSLIFESRVSIDQIGEVIWSLLFLGIMSSGVAYTLQILGQKEVDPTVSSIILSLESVFGLIGAVLFLGERMEAREYIGCGIVLLAVLLAQTNIKKIFKGKDKSNE